MAPAGVVASALVDVQVSQSASSSPEPPARQLRRCGCPIGFSSGCDSSSRRRPPYRPLFYFLCQHARTSSPRRVAFVPPHVGVHLHDVLSSPHAHAAPLLSAALSRRCAPRDDVRAGFRGMSTAAPRGATTPGPSLRLRHRAADGPQAERASARTVALWHQL